MSMRFIFIHGNQSTHWSYGWAPWFKKKLEKLGLETFFETFPDSVIARQEYWLPFLKDHVQAGPDDVIVGWSSGATAAMRYAESNKIKGSVLISPSYTDLGDDLEKQSGYFVEPWNWEQIKNNQEKIALFYGDDDPYIPQSEFEFIASQLHPEIHKIHEGGHFSETLVFPEVLEYVKENYL